MYRINCKFADEVLVPANAIAGEFYLRPPAEVPELLTADGAPTMAEFIRTLNNKDGMFDAELEQYCQDRFGMTFDYFRKIWYSRLGRVDDYWHFIKLKKI